MPELQQQPFSYSELKTLVELGHSYEALQQTAEVVYQLRLAIRANPDIDWDSFLITHQLQNAETAEKELLRNTFNRYKKNRQAVKYWEDEFSSDREGTLIRIRQALDIPSEIQIKSITFLPDSCVVRMSLDDVNELYDHNLKKHGEIRGSGLVTVGGFVSQDLFLTDSAGGKVRISFVSYDGKDPTIELHEQEHTIFSNYYLRNDSTDDASIESIKETAKNEYLTTVDKIEGRRQDSHKVMSVGLRQLRSETVDMKLTFINEIVAEAASLVGESTARRVSKMDTVFWFISNHFKVIDVHSISGTIHSYGENLRMAVEGIEEGLEEIDLDKMEKLKIRYEFELETASVYADAVVMARWYNKLWKLVQYDPDRFVSILETIPFKYKTAVAYFVGEEPEDIEQDLATETESVKQKELVLARVLYTVALNSPSIAELASREELTELFHRLFAQALDTDSTARIAQELPIVLTTVIARAYTTEYAKHVNTYLNTYRDTLRLLHELGCVTSGEDEGFFLHDFIEVSIREYFNFEAIKSGLKNQLLERGVPDGQIVELLQIYEDSIFRDRQNQDGFGYEIIRQEKEMWQRFGIPARDFS